MAKRYFWLKLYDDFFTSKRIKKLRSIAGGDTYTIIYLKMQLKALKTDGYLYFDGVMQDFAEELALDIDEKPEDVQITINYLLSVGLIECNETGEEFYLTYMDNVIGSETASAQRVRDFRQRQKEAKALQCNTDVTQMKRLCNAEKEIEKEIEIEIEIDIDKESKKTAKRFLPPSVEEVQAYCKERGNNVDANAFVDFYESKGWMVGKSKMKDWKACVRTWEQRDKKDKKTQKKISTERDYNYNDLETRLLGR